MGVTKTRKLRGSRTHGWGAGKKHRGAGHRGGRGNAGSGKRGQQKVTKFLAQGTRGIGFGRPIKAKGQNKVLNLRELASRVKSWEARGKVTKEKGVVVVDLKKLGYDKLLGNGDLGELKGKVKVIVDNISESAKSKLGVKEESKAPKGEEQ